MSLSNLCFFTLLASIVVFPSVRKSELDIPRHPTNPAKVDLPLPVQFRNLKDLGPGKLLVASRDLADPNFVQTVILLVHYDNDGVIGLILNRRTDVPVSRVFAKLEAAKNRSDRVYRGGPVEGPTVFALLQSADKFESAEHVYGGVYWIAAKTALEKAISSRPDPDVFHIYLGYAGWTTDQLKNEVRLGGWFIFPADNKTVFNANPDSLWRQMIKKTELKMAGSPTEAGPQALVAQP
jgi:putative transcriptional regulator